MNSVDLKNEGNEFYLKKNFINAIDCYKRSLELTKDKILRVQNLSNLAQCYLCLDMYEDALDHCNFALRIDPEFMKAKFRKARALMRLFRFEESLKVLDKLSKKEAKKEIENLNLIKE